MSRRSYGYIAKRCHAYLRQQSPVMYAQATGGQTGYITDVDAVLGAYTLRYISSGRLCIYDRPLTSFPVELIIMDNEKVVRLDVGAEAILFEDFLPKIEAALVLDDLSEL